MVPGFVSFFVGLLALVSVSSLASAQSFAKGADPSWLPQMEAAGITFRDTDGTRKDALQILKDHGMDTVRLRVWVNPSKDPRSGHCGKNEVVAMAVRAKKLGMRVMIDFHYSDSWADPAKQTKPAAWKAHSFDELKEDVYQHTLEVLRACVARGVTPEWVQIGNEIRGGMLWPEGSTENFSQLTQLLNRGYDAVKAVEPSIKVLIHLDRGNDNKTFRWFFDGIAPYGPQYDVIAMSYYPFWLKSDYTETIDDLARNLQDMSTRYGKEVMVVEVGGESRKADNTRMMLKAVIEKVRAVKDGKGLGVIYWEPQSLRSWSHYALGCWNEDGTPNAALNAFKDAGGVGNPADKSGKE